MSDIELREILSELLPHVRMDHVLPPNNETLHSAIRRGLVSTPPSHMIGDDRENLRINAWIRGGKNHGLFVRPRLFVPYYDEVKSLLEDQSQQIELLRLRRSRHYPDIPDTLYMVSRLNRCSVGNVSSSSNDLLLTTQDVASASTIPAPDPSSFEAMQKREHKLIQNPMCQRALALATKHEIYRQIRLRVVREFNFPDEVAVLLENSVSCFCNDDLNNKIDDDSVDEEIITLPSSPIDRSNENIPESLSNSQYGSSNMTFQRQQGGTPQPHQISGSYRRLDPQSNDTNYSESEGAASCAEGGHISMIMPDVTASLGQIQIDAGNTSENIDGLHLDLGDGSHIISTQPRPTQSVHLYGTHSSYMSSQQARLSSSVGNYHHYMTRYMAGSSQQQQPPLPNSPLAHASSSTIQMHHLSNQVPSNSQFIQQQQNRRAESSTSSSNFRASSSHSSSFL